jgi:hypothetical protein
VSVGSTRSSSTATSSSLRGPRDGAGERHGRSTMLKPDHDDAVLQRCLMRRQLRRTSQRPVRHLLFGVVAPARASSILVASVGAVCCAQLPPTSRAAQFFVLAPGRGVGRNLVIACRSLLQKRKATRRWPVSTHFLRYFRTVSAASRAASFTSPAAL